MITGVEAGGLTAQDTPPFPPDAHVRVTHAIPSTQSEVRITGMLIGLRADSILIGRRSDDSVFRVSLRSLRRLEIGRGHVSRAGRGALLGLVTGAAGGLVAGLRACSGGTCNQDGDDWSVPVVLLSTLGGGLIGTGIGAFIGSLFHREQWDDIPLERLRAPAGPAQDPGISVSVSSRTFGSTTSRVPDSGRRVLPSTIHHHS